tara:strand:+ start:18 stop:608 length:591 start_codon:yes stop_codon:yes gene_type:complete
MEMNKSGLAKELVTALVGFQSSISSVPKSTKGYNYKYSDLATVWDNIRKPLADNGLAVVQTTRNLDDGTPVVITTLFHISGQFIEGELAIKPTKMDAQGVGSVISYARRYSLMSILGIAAAGEDDDGAKASKPAKASQPAKDLAPKSWITKLEAKIIAAENMDINVSGLTIDKHPTKQQIQDTAAKLEDRIEALNV